MEELGLPQRRVGVPPFVLVAEVRRVVLGIDVAELAREEGVPTVREDERITPVQLVHDLHVKLPASGGGDRRLHPRELGGGRLDEDERGGEHRRGGGGEPVGTGEGGGGGREEEELVHGLEERCVGVEGEDTGVLRLVEDEQLGVAFGPRRCR